jgi:hypothetical protein
MSYKRLNSITIEDTATERHHNTIGNRTVAIAHLEHHIIVLQIFFSF